MVLTKKDCDTFFSFKYGASSEIISPSTLIIFSIFITNAIDFVRHEMFDTLIFRIHVLVIFYILNLLLFEFWII